MTEEWGISKRTKMLPWIWSREDRDEKLNKSSERNYYQNQFFNLHIQCPRQSNSQWLARSLYKNPNHSYFSHAL